jgi:predicted dehydrogenase
MVRIGVVGLGYWGPNLVRCFSSIEGCQLTAVCDQSLGQLKRIKSHHPAVFATDSFDDLLDRVDAVVIATPTGTHFKLASTALMRKLHVFVEKPLAKTTMECRQLVELAEQNGRILFVGHVFLHSAPVKTLRDLVASGDLGSISYISSRRLNLGPVRKDVSALYDLAPHDISMMLYLLGQSPDSVTCSGFDRLKPGVHDVCNLTMNFKGNRMGMIHVSWLDPRKERVLTVVGDRKMAVYDDLEQEKIKIFDKGIDVPTSSSGDYADFQHAYRYGGSYCPYIHEFEPLKAECADFVRCILHGETPLTDGVNGLQVVEVLQAANESLFRGGHPIQLGLDDPVASTI